MFDRVPGKEGVGRKNSRIHSPTEQDLIFIVHCHHNEELRFATQEIGSQSVLGPHKIIGVTSGSGVAQLGHFLLGFPALWYNMGRGLHIEDKVTLLQFDLTNRASFHKFLASNRPTSALFSKHSGSLLHGWIVWLEGHGGHRRVVDLGHVILGVEMSLRASKAALI